MLIQDELWWCWRKKIWRKKNLENNIRRSAFRTLRCSWESRRSDLGLASCPVPAKLLCGAAACRHFLSGADSNIWDGGHVWFLAASLLLLLIPLEMHTPFLAQGHTGVFPGPRAVQALVRWLPGWCLCTWLSVGMLYSVCTERTWVSTVILWWSWQKVTWFSVTPSTNSAFDHIFYFDYFHNMTK